MLFPRERVAGHFEIGNHEAGETCLGAAANTGRTFVADFTTDAGRCAREGRDGGRVIVGLHFAQNIELCFGVAVVALVAALVDFEPSGRGAFEHARVVGVRDQGAFRVQLVGVADHAEQRQFALLAVDNPVGVENFVAAVLGVDLREHHQLGVGWVALHFLVSGDQVVDLVGTHGQAPVDVGLAERFGAFDHERHGAQHGRLEMAEKVADIVVDRFGHTVVQGEQRETEMVYAENHSVFGDQAQMHAALDALDALHRAIVKNIGRLGGPRRNGALARGDEKAALAVKVVLGREQSEGALGGLVVERAFGFDEIDFDGVNGGDCQFGDSRVERALQRGETEIGKCGTALKNDRMHSSKSLKKSKVAWDSIGNNPKNSRNER